MTTTTAADLAPVTLPTEIASIAHVQLPSFWRHAPRQWFTHADAIFHTSRVRSDLSRVNHVLASLDDEGIRTVSDLLGVDASYSLMRERLISSYTALHSARFQSIVQPGEMGDRTPSQLLRDMREVYPEGMPDATLEQFWLAKLPTAVRTVIAGFSGPLDTLAERAYRIFEAYLIAANGSKIKTFGPKQLQLDLGLNRVFTWTFELADVGRPILGADFLHYYGLLVDIRRSRLVDTSHKFSVQAALAPDAAPAVICAIARPSKWTSLLLDFPEFQDKIIKLVGISILETFVKVKVGNTNSDPILVKSGLRQGDAMSPILFNIVVEKVVREMNITLQEGVKFQESSIGLLAYADDLVIMEDS
ncbi:hypothetical protein QTP88_011661 [Uroleucon formosanum]